MPAIAQLKLMREIDTAEGIWLDRLGKRLGLMRPATTDPIADERFGYDDAGEPFDSAPFKGSAENDAVHPLPDAVYRRFLKARAILLLADGTYQAFERAVREIDEGADVQDRRNMTVRIVTTRRSFLELAGTHPGFPLPAAQRSLVSNACLISKPRTGSPDFSGRQSPRPIRRPDREMLRQRARGQPQGQRQKPSRSGGSRAAG